MLAPHRPAKRAAELATVRFETAPGHQTQIDFSEKWNEIAGARTKVLHPFVAVLGYSRRIFVRASLSQRQDDWREGFARAFRTFVGITRKILIDRAGALVIGEDRETHTARVHPAVRRVLQRLGRRGRGVPPLSRAYQGQGRVRCRLRERNAIAGLSFASFAALDTHLEQGMVSADERTHGTSHEQPGARFERDERAALRPLPSTSVPVRERRIKRRVANDCVLDVVARARAFVIGEFRGSWQRRKGASSGSTSSQADRLEVRAGLGCQHEARRLPAEPVQLTDGSRLPASYVFDTASRLLCHSDPHPRTSSAHAGQSARPRRPPTPSRAPVREPLGWSAVQAPLVEPSHTLDPLATAPCWRIHGTGWRPRCTRRCDES